MQAEQDHPHEHDLAHRHDEHGHVNPHDLQRSPPPDHSHIRGWGVDKNPADRPAYPMERTPPRLEGVHWDQPEQQRQTVKVFQSTERPGMTPVFGTSTPPKGISGLLRGLAYRF